VLGLDPSNKRVVPLYANYLDLITHQFRLVKYKKAYQLYLHHLTGAEATRKGRERGKRGARSAREIIPWRKEKIGANTTLCGNYCTKHKNKSSFAHDHIYLSTCCTYPK
jgi:hypothetical protein